MLISPPFLPVRSAQQADESWLKEAIIQGEPGDGFFPISFEFGWHGGAHLAAPQSGSHFLSVRAIADGKVIYCRKPTSKSADPAHPLNYRGGWTDNGCIVIQHETSIGIGDDASSIVFFSIYMHLSEIFHGISLGSKISRKDEIGEAGQIYGSTIRKIHFEIVSDDVNTRHILGRDSGDLSLKNDGRVDAVYGNVYYLIPSGVPIYDQCPLPQFSVAHYQPEKTSASSPPPFPSELQPVAITECNLIVGVSHGEGVEIEQGDCLVSSYREDGTSLGKSLREPDAGYQIYRSAAKICKAYPEESRPAQSVVYEVLRFGRLLNSEHELSQEVAITHWRKIRYPDGIGWVNLNAGNIKKFSDADFPHWRGWTIIDDSADGNSRCDSQIVKSWLGPEMENIDPIAMASVINEPIVRGKLNKAICRFPSEWNLGTIDARWDWLMTRSNSNPNPLNTTDYNELKQHIGALCFESAVINAAQWHWPPFEFFVHFRKCSWLSSGELQRCIPAAYQTETSIRGSQRITVQINASAAAKRVELRDADLFMRICRKYDIGRPNRLSHFLAQIFRETSVFQWSQELGTGEEYQGRQDLGNTSPGDGVRYKGRGLMQTTGRVNYAKYSEYRGRFGSESYLREPNNLELAKNPYTCADTAGLYWVSRAVGGQGVSININRRADEGISEATLRAVTKSVNGAEDGIRTGLFERRSHLSILKAILLDGASENILPARERRYV